MQADIIDFGMEATSKGDNFSLKSIEIGGTFGGKPNVDLDLEIPGKKYSKAILTLTNSDDETLKINLNFPKLDEGGNIKMSLNKSFGFYNNSFNFLFSLLYQLDPNNIIDEKTGEEIKKFTKFNMLKALEFIHQKEWVDIEVIADVDETEYNSFKITRMD